MGRWLIYGVGWWVVLFPVYVLLAGSLAGDELLVGAGLSALAAVAATVTRRAGHLHFRPRLRWLAHFRRLPGRVLADCVVVTVALGRALAGRKVEGAFRSIPFDAGGDDPESAARRALVMAGACLAPNSYVVLRDDDNGVLLMHQLVPTEAPPGGGDRAWPL